VTERIASAQAEERPKSSDENTGSQSALQNGTLLAASISLMKEENWERKLFCRLTTRGNRIKCQSSVSGTGAEAPFHLLSSAAGSAH
jgi:hypothetical protein